ncbi:hypothetical protein BDP27DRAFT_97469 [Rhodocollybia butyracea]|uniref:Uncharacterized protein n=1 Tax=Rhodocollybia butyracea TaxID=206335 RepID=A0A9P5Q6J0_9AGAR|nr:hypothetical protein BDP27DRAFT_97469 [Rhodocollybia butyracea]
MSCTSFLTIKVELSFVAKRRSLKMQEPTERSLSRGRQLISSGRGGMGNMHTASVDSRPQTGPDDLSITRGRDLAINPDRVLSIGRGGAGNIRSPSCHSPVTPQAIDLRQQELLKAEGGDRTQLVSFGRGGLGNMGRSPSRGALLNQENSEITAVRSRVPTQNPAEARRGRAASG